jgi:hypothetical protein
MEGVGEYGRRAVGPSTTALRDHRYHRECAERVQVLRWDHSPRASPPTKPFPRLRNTVETECMQHGCRIGACEVSPLRHSPHPCLGADPHPALEKGRCPAAFSFTGGGTAAHLFPCAAGSSAIGLAIRARTRRVAMSISHQARIGVTHTARYRLPSKVKPRRGEPAGLN